MSTRDRGMMKWTSFMIPEHVKKLNTFLHDEYYNVEEPAIDEQQLDEMNELVAESMEYTFPLDFTVYQNKRLITISGLVHYVDPIKMQMKVVDKDGVIHTVPFRSIKGVKKTDA